MTLEVYRKDFATTQAAHDALPADGGTVWFDSITYTKDGCFITKPNVRLICPSGIAQMVYPLDQPDHTGAIIYAALIQSKGIFVTKGATKTATGKYDETIVSFTNHTMNGVSPNIVRTLATPPWAFSSFPASARVPSP